MQLSRTPLVALAGLACVVAIVGGASGCGEMKPRPVADRAPPPPPPKDPRATRDPNSPDIGHNSASTLGKARDAAARGVEAAEKHSQEVGKQADEVFKTK